MSVLHTYLFLLAKLLNDYMVKIEENLGGNILFKESLVQSWKKGEITFVKQ